MTLKGKTNHYNVKFLKGYGFSINVKNSKIVLKSNYDPFKEPEVEEWYVKNMPYEKIVLSGKGYISTEALRLLSEHNRNLILLDTYGKPVTYLNPVMESLTATRYRIGGICQNCGRIWLYFVKSKRENFRMSELFVNLVAKRRQQNNRIHRISPSSNC